MDIFNCSLFIGSFPSTLKILKTQIFKTKQNSLSTCIPFQPCLSLSYLSRHERIITYWQPVFSPGLLNLLSCLDLCHSKTKQQNKKIYIKGTGELLVAQVFFFKSLPSPSCSLRSLPWPNRSSQGSYCALPQHTVLWAQNQSHCIVVICLLFLFPTRQ